MGVGWGGVGMMTFLALAHMFDATQQDVSLGLAHMFDATQQDVSLGFAHLFDATQQDVSDFHVLSPKKKRVRNACAAI